jgi:Flp pilus assembly protein TadG
MFRSSPYTERRSGTRKRRGTISILAALMSIVLLGMVAFSVDVGYVLSSKEELQRTADSAALAACWEYAQQLADGADYQSAMTAGRTTASYYALQNEVGNQGPTLNVNTSNSPGGDVVFGYINDLYDSNAQLDTNATSNFNAVHIAVRRNGSLNGQIPYFFARVFGLTGQDLSADALAGVIRDVSGFQTPHSGGNLDILPFALDVETYNKLVNGCSSDEWKWDAVDEEIEAGTDGRVEVNLYPQGTGSPGNRGTVDIGGANNSTNDIARQIVYGISPADMAALGKELKFDENGELFLNGDTGISAGVKDELASIKGQPRIIPIFEEVNGPGNNAEYTIIKWLGIRIMDVKLTGPYNKKHVTIQVAPIVSAGVIQSTTTGTSTSVYSPVVLLK